MPSVSLSEQKIRQIGRVKDLRLLTLKERTGLYTKMKLRNSVSSPQNFQFQKSFL